MEKEVYYLEIKQEKEYLYKVTRRLPRFSLSDTKTFTNKDMAVDQVIEWLK